MHIKTMFREIIFAIISKLKGKTILPSCRITEKIQTVQCGYVNFFLYRKNGNIVCFDAGFNIPHILKELQNLETEPELVADIFLTHSDYDHFGGIAAFPNARVFISEQEIHMLEQNVRRPLGLKKDSPEIKEMRQVRDGEIIYSGDIKVECILTPGHTFGSMSYLVDDRFLFLGDSCGIKNRQIVPLKNYINMDPWLHKASIEKLKQREGVEMSFVGHTGYKYGF